jgi:transcription termination/antitermination protein NusA
MTNKLNKDESQNLRAGDVFYSGSELRYGADTEQLERARMMRRAGEDDPRELQREMEKLDAETEEEVDALRVNLLQDDEYGLPRDGTGKVVDNLAEEKITEFTEVGPLAGERGAVAMTPGRDDTSNILRRHHPNTGIARAENIVEGNMDEPREEITREREVDEGNAA